LPEQGGTAVAPWTTEDTDTDPWHPPLPFAGSSFAGSPPLIYDPRGLSAPVPRFRRIVQSYPITRGCGTRQFTKGVRHESGALSDSVRSRQYPSVQVRSAASSARRALANSPGRKPWENRCSLPALGRGGRSRAKNVLRPVPGLSSPPTFPHGLRRGL